MFRVPALPPTAPEPMSVPFLPEKMIAPVEENVIRERVVFVVMFMSRFLPSLLAL